MYRDPFLQGTSLEALIPQLKLLSRGKNQNSEFPQSLVYVSIFHCHFVNAFANSLFEGLPLCLCIAASILKFFCSSEEAT